MDDYGGRVILYSALLDDFYPFDIFHPDAEKRILQAGELPDNNDGYLIVWGGGDIHPSQYGRENVASNTTGQPTRRDVEEERMMRRAIEIGLPIVGVCRGAQLACALAGGILVQHVTGHTSTHMMITGTGRRLTTSSLHHQLMYPWALPDEDYEIIGHATPSRSKEYLGLTEYEEQVAAYEVEPEIIWFPRIKALAIQGHPEFMEANCDFNQYVRELIHERIQKSVFLPS